MNILEIYFFLSFIPPEPVGKVKPKITKLPPIDSVIVGSSIPILCPAQAYPPPLYRYVIWLEKNRFILNWSKDPLKNVLEKTLKLFFWIEPIGSVVPRLTSGDSSRSIIGSLLKNVTLVCPAQAYPVPLYR